jgi:hypothetical protein
MPAAVAAAHVYWVYGGNVGGNARSPSRDWCAGRRPDATLALPHKRKHKRRLAALDFRRGRGPSVSCSRGHAHASPGQSTREPRGRPHARNSSRARVRGSSLETPPFVGKQRCGRVSDRVIVSRSVPSGGRYLGRCWSLTRAVSRATSLSKLWASASERQTAMCLQRLDGARVRRTDAPRTSTATLLEELRCDSIRFATTR